MCATESSGCREPIWPTTNSWENEARKMKKTVVGEITVIDTIYFDTRIVLLGGGDQFF